LKFFSNKFTFLPTVRSGLECPFFVSRVHCFVPIEKEKIEFVAKNSVSRHIIVIFVLVDLVKKRAFDVSKLKVSLSIR